MLDVVTRTNVAGLGVFQTGSVVMPHLYATLTADGQDLIKNTDFIVS